VCTAYAESLLGIDVTNVQIKITLKT